jgi:D-glycero-alpha-D-manno-heptose-7-phosphate kinase
LDAAPGTWRVPVRIDLAGGTLDLWPIYAMLPGCLTVNAAVDLWIHLAISPDGPARIESADLGLAFPSEPWPDTPPEGLSWVWRVLSIVDRRPHRLQIQSPVPRGSGLGVSSCMGAGLLGAALGLEAGEALAAFVPRLRDLEAMELQTPTGWQDYYPAALGGTLALHWDGPQPRWERLVPHPSLMDRLLVFYTGAPHHSGLTNWEAYRRFIEGDATTREALREIRDIAREMAAAVPADAHAVAELLEREGRARARLSPAVETDAMRAVRDRGRREGWFEGLKPCGAGGGGCCLLVAKAGRREEAERALAALGLPLLPVTITERGLHRS